MKTPFRIRAAKLVNRILHIRLTLIARGASRNKAVDWKRCKDFQQQIEPLKSDRQWAAFLSGNAEWLQQIVSPRNRAFQRQLVDLQLEAMVILNQED